MVVVSATWVLTVDWVSSRCKLNGFGRYQCWRVYRNWSFGGHNRCSCVIAVDHRGQFNRQITWKHEDNKIIVKELWDRDSVGDPSDYRPSRATDNAVQNDVNTWSREWKDRCWRSWWCEKSFTERIPNRLQSEYLLFPAYAIGDWRWHCMIFSIAAEQVKVKLPLSGRWRRRLQSRTRVYSHMSLVGLKRKYSSCAAGVCRYFHNA